MTAPRKPIQPGGLLLTRQTRRRRERLSDLERDVDPSEWEERRAAARALLARPLLTEAHEERRLVQRHREWLALWFAHHVGWELHVDADACRLVKRPAHLSDTSRPCRDPTSKDTALTRRGYVFLCLVLSILTREGRQFTLKHLAERIGGLRHAEPVFEEKGVHLDLDRREGRRDLVHALRVLLDWGVLARVDGSEDQFVMSDQADALYNVRHPVLSRLLAARQPPSLVETEDFEARLFALWMGGATAEESDDWRTREIRHGLFRRLLDDPVVYYDDLDEEENAYFESQRVFIVREIERATGLVSEVRAEGLAMVDHIGDLSDYHLPEVGTDGHLTLLMATRLAEHLRNGPDRPIPIRTLEAEVRALAHANTQWRNEARVPGSEVVLTRGTVHRLSALGLVREVHDPEPSVLPLPAIGRYGLREPDLAAREDTQEALL